MTRVRHLAVKRPRHTTREAHLAVTRLGRILLALCLSGCALPAEEGEALADASTTIAVDGGGHPEDAGGSTTDGGVDPRLGGVAHTADPFADQVVAFTPGPTAGYGQERMPQVLLGPPQGDENGGGSLDVVSLGKEGVVVLELTDIILRDGPGPDLRVFENVFSSAWQELGAVAVSEDGVTFYEWPCGADGGTEGCAGLSPVYSSPTNGISATSPDAGGDAFDLAALQLSSARFVRIRDTGTNTTYGGNSGGFDLDAIAVQNGRWLDGGAEWTP